MDEQYQSTRPRQVPVKTNVADHIARWIADEAGELGIKPAEYHRMILLAAYAAHRRDFPNRHPSPPTEDGSV